MSLHMWHSIGRGYRSLVRRPGFLVAAVLTLALCVGANSAMFSLIDAVLLRPLPYPASERLAVLFETNAARKTGPQGVAGQAGPTGPAGAPVMVSDTAPASPVSGMQWLDSTTAQLYIWYTDPTSSQWVGAAW